MKHTPQKIAAWSRIHRRRSLLIGGLVIIALVSSIWAWQWYTSRPSTPDTTPIAVAKKPKPIFHSPLTGSAVDEAATKRPVTAIMIENSPEARPHSGLKQAGIVYEAIAEGGITRYAALYQESRPSLIGPVRSLRPYFLDWITPYNASIAHVGGSAKALEEVRNGSHRDIDQFFNDDSYWRADDRYAPHNVYTSFDKLDALNAAKHYSSSTFTGFERTDETASGASASHITINFSSTIFNTSYDYDTSSHTYKRSLGGEPHMDREEGQIAPRVVIALDVSMSLVMEDGWRESIQTNGSGRAVIFQDGTVTEAVWKKDSMSGNLQLLSSSDEPIKLARGQTWIAAVPAQGGTVAW